MKKETLEVTHFTEHPEAKETLKKLRQHFGASNPLKVSDVYLDEETEKYPGGVQFVNLVQEGGGVLGIGLVGYTWLLEKMGIRFYSLAGTSAGAINTLLLAAMGGLREEKSEKILKELCEKDLFDFIDGNWLAKALIRNIFTRVNYIGHITRLLTLILGAGIIIPVVGVLILGFSDLSGQGLQNIQLLFGILTILAWIGIGALVYTYFSLRNKFYRSGYGINPGKSFYDWINVILLKHGANSMKSLYNIMEINTSADGGKDVASNIGLKLRKIDNDERNLNDLPRKLAIVTSDITIQSKIEFPDMAALYWADVESVNPAQFVRASMSIPVFFESYQVKIPVQSDKVHRAWQHFQNLEADKIPEYARFVDGGMISNFPINIFHNANQKVARLPTFGIRLDDLSKPHQRSTETAETEMVYKSFASYLWTMFNTVRYYYDKDFLLKNRLYDKSIAFIDTYNFNWLNFNMNNKEKVRLFLRGVKAAEKFLMNFNWDEYKENRSEVMERIVKNKKEADKEAVS